VQKNLNLHLLIPATDASPNFCRTALTAELLDYPTPVLVNWGGKVDSNNRFATHLAKIESILTYLQGLPATTNKDLILIVDGYDVWFQLRPEVLIQRYYDTIRKGNERLSGRIKPEELEEHDFRETVLFGADKKCWPQDPNGLICNVLPESSLPRDVFGDKTDDGDPKHSRPRWVNSGTILGPVEDVRSIFEAASKRVKERFHGWSDQYYFAEIFGEQELRRNSVSTKPKDLKQYLVNDDRKTSYRRIQHDPNVEFHISMEYEAALFHTNAFATDDTEWITFNTSTMDKGDTGHEEIHVDPRLAIDILNSRPPIFEGLVAEDLFGEAPALGELPFDTTWSNVPLLYNKITGHVPVILHMNGDKSLLNDWWGELWWAKRKWGEHLLRSTSRSPRGPLLTTMDDETGESVTWWKGSYNSQKVQNGGYWTSSGRWVDYDNVCAKHEDVLFKGKKTVISKQKGGWLGTPPHSRQRRHG
jgi:hypothetical protein